MGLSLNLSPGDVIYMTDTENPDSRVVTITGLKKSGSKSRLMIEADPHIKINLVERDKKPPDKNSS